MITYKFRLKDSSTAWLNKAARAVNFVWNYCNETSHFAIKNRNKFLSGFDLNYLTSGSCKELKISSSTVQEVCEEYALRRKQFKKIKLKWRSKKSLGWVPFKGHYVKIINDSITYNKNKVKFWKSREIVGKIRSGSFSQDARGRWYINIVADGLSVDASPDASVGIDLGLKDLATLSNGVKYKSMKYFRRYERLLKLSQKDKKKKRTKALHAKIKNSRLDNNHKISTEISSEFNFIFVGNVSSSNLIKTKMAKSVLDAGWGQLKTFLKYKAIRHSGKMYEINEYLTSQTCSSCGTTSASSPRGLKGLGIREWVCDNCGAVHDRDVNAALNILRLGHQSLSLKGDRNLRSLEQRGCQNAFTSL